jgi:hypothetical protein
METKSEKINISCSWPIYIIVFLAFFIAKIFDKIDWSWWWVFSPLWIPMIFIIIITILIIISKIWIEW